MMETYQDIEVKFNGLKKGDLLIFTKNSGVSAGRPGDVITFNNFIEKSPCGIPWNVYIQCKEILEAGNNQHNFCLDSLDFFTKEKYPDYRFITYSMGQWAEILPEEKNVTVINYNSFDDDYLTYDEKMIEDQARTITRLQSENKALKEENQKLYDELKYFTQE